MFARFLKSKPQGTGHGPAVEMPVLGRDTDIELLLNSGIVLIFKHSAACPVSWMAHAHVTRFRTRNPGIAVHLVPVIQERATSQRIAERTKVRHESPQVILLRNGAVECVASHEEITEAYLSEIVAALDSSA